MTPEEQKRTEVLKALDDYRVLVGDIDTLALLINLSTILSIHNNLYKDKENDTLH